MKTRTMFFGAAASLQPSTTHCLKGNGVGCADAGALPLSFFDPAFFGRFLAQSPQ